MGRLFVFLLSKVRVLRVSETIKTFLSIRSGPGSACFVTVVSGCDFFACRLARKLACIPKSHDLGNRNHPSAQRSSGSNKNPQAISSKPLHCCLDPSERIGSAPGRSLRYSVGRIPTRTTLSSAVQSCPLAQIISPAAAEAEAAPVRVAPAVL